ncbi:MAG: translation initiation factor IF-3 [Chloroflexi bacterium]|nr:MAG: translation initiation factor IF-3 [Chloroflexota bacterium]
MIRIREVRVIDDEGQQLGVMQTADALALAQERGLDLVEVAPTAVPPVCKILDYGQYKYEIQKRERETKKKQKSQTFKEIRFRVKIDTHDLATKTRRASEFLDDGDRVKVTVQFRGRELNHPQLGRNLLERAAEMIGDHGVIERPPLMEGRSLFIVMAPPTAKADRREEEAAPSDGAAADGGGETIGDALQTKGQVPEVADEPPAAAPA